MSVFTTTKVTCPGCGEALSFDVVQSLNADRRPDLRAAVLDGRMQREACPHCDATFRLDPDFNYLDVAHSQWIATLPAVELARWGGAESRAKETFEAAFGASAPEPARELGADLDVRVAFGWAALREKLFLAELELDDVTVELMKIAMIRGLPSSPLANDTELRLVDTDDADFVMAWIRSADESVVEMLRVPRVLYHEIEGSEDWDELRAQIAEGPFVDALRLMVEPAGS